MSKNCDVCGKGPLFGQNRSHALNATKRKYYPNLQKIRAEIDGEAKNIKICTSCLKANKVRKVI